MEKTEMNMQTRTSGASLPAPFTKSQQLKRGVQAKVTQKITYTIIPKVLQMPGTQSTN